MRFPSKIRIGPYTYSVHFKRKIGPENLHGEILHGSQKIKVKGGLPDERSLTILVHEALHGIDQYMDIGLSEKQITRLAPGLVALWQDNKEAFAGLLEDKDV